ncbi:hypothetical protein IFM89_013269 [Coptis chinensis]|uniref:NADH dehydrogenase [ubiquinone] 1 beta subcomplex subunit 7 n=1 Tax=Coptis chinensis TaxID=261450 RepID=A0A835MI97_9MAGN|nr:hypothetical protein IFM89_013269 [Coptis chinensis]
MEVEGSSKKMIATQEEMVEAKVPIPYRDQCAHLLIPLNKCRSKEFFLPWKCEDERHVYEKCEYELVMERMLMMKKFVRPKKRNLCCRNKVLEFLSFLLLLILDAPSGRGDRGTGRNFGGGDCTSSYGGRGSSGDRDSQCTHYGRFNHTEEVPTSDPSPLSSSQGQSKTSSNKEIKVYNRRPKATQVHPPQVFSASVHSVDRPIALRKGSLGYTTETEEASGLCFQHCGYYLNELNDNLQVLVRLSPIKTMWRK